MESLDPAKNDGSSKRRISSILKAPRKSIRFPDTEQQENTVEPPKPVDKRNSRRVSFAPANDVLLFSKDIKNGSPVRSPLQELRATASAAVATQKGVSVAFTEDQPIMGMETLLNAPLYASQHMDKVKFDYREDFAEKTMVFSTDDGFMDMTHSHTINIGSDAELLGDISLHNYDAVSSSREKLDLGVGKRDTFSSVACLDPDFENFLASLSKPSKPVGTIMTPPGATASEGTQGSLAQIKTQRPNMDKDNQAPPSVSAMEKSISASRKIGPTSYGSALCPEDDISMDMTEVQTGRIQGFTDVDNDHFQCLFPRKDKTSSVEESRHNTYGLSSPSKTGVPGGKGGQSKSFGKLFHGGIISNENDNMDMTETQTGRIIGHTPSDDPFQFLLPTQNMYPSCESLRGTEVTTGQKKSKAAESSYRGGIKTLFKPSLNAKVQRHQVKYDTEDDSREKTVRFTADDACMDVTQCHTVNIMSDFEQRSHQNVEFLPACSERTVRFTADDAAMDVTRSHTVNIVTDLEPLSQKNADVLPLYGEKTVKFTANDAAMDVTRSHTVNIVTDFAPFPQKNTDVLPSYGEKTVKFTANDAAMDVTRSHTVNIVTDFKQLPQKNTDVLPLYGEKTVKFNANDAGMDVTRSHTVNIFTDLEPLPQKNADALPSYGERTVKFTANDAAMDVTRSHTVNIVTDLEPLQQKNADALPSYGEKTVKFTANDAAMDVTQSHTVNIVTDFKLLPQKNADVLPTYGEKTVKFTANDAAMDVTRSHTVNIVTDLEPLPQKNADVSAPYGQRTAKCTANDAAMDVTQSHTVNIATTFKPKPNSDKKMDVFPTFGEKIVKFIADDAAMDTTNCLTVNIASNSVSDSDSNIIASHKDIDLPLSVRKRESEACLQGRAQPSSGNSLGPGFRNSLSRKSVVWVNPVITRAPCLAATTVPETMDRNDFQEQLQVQKPDVDAENEALGFEKHVNKTILTDCPADDVSMEMTEAQMGHILEQTCIKEASHGPPSPQSYPYTDNIQITEVTSRQSNEALISISADVEIPNRSDSLDSNESDIWKEPEPRNQNYASSQKIESSPPVAEQVVDAAASRKSRRTSLAELHSKIRRLSHMINTAPDAMDTAPLPQLELEMENKPIDKIKPEIECESKTGLLHVEENKPIQCLVEEEQPSTTTPFKLQTKQLMSRLSVGGFQAKLPQRSKPEDPNKVKPVEENRNSLTINITNQLSSFDNDVSDINDEELGSCEDMSEMVDTKSLLKTTEIESFPQESQEFNLPEPLVDDVFEEDFIGTAHGKKRPLLVDEEELEDEKKVKTSMTTPNTETKLEDGSITVSEFFKIFNIDFVIHNPHQCVPSGRIASDTEYTLMDLLKDRHINLPKQAVYETDVENLTEKVEGLKERIRDLDQPLKIVNRALWEEIRSLSENELKLFGAKLKERNNLFRKMSKVQSHEMKEVLYSNIVRTNLEEQQKLRAKIEQADGMIKSLDDCISKLETELAAVEGNELEDKQSLKSKQKEMQRVTQALADNDKEISELEMQQKQNANKVKRLRAETRNLESHITVLHMMNEWKVEEKRDNCVVYSFLHGTFFLVLVYEESSENAAEKDSGRKISHMTFKAQLDDEKSQDHACLVHKLICQYIDGEGAWGEKYLTSRHVPKLLHDVGLVVSRCRLLGEELRLLKMWGALKLDILSISCVDTEVHIVFSSLKKLTKFEVIFSIGLSNHLCVLQVQSFKNIFGNTTIQQIQEIVASFSPAKNMLTKIIKKIHETLLC